MRRRRFDTLMMLLPDSPPLFYYALDATRYQRRRHAATLRHADADTR